VVVPSAVASDSLCSGNRAMSPLWSSRAGLLLHNGFSNLCFLSRSGELRPLLGPEQDPMVSQGLAVFRLRDGRAALAAWTRRSPWEQLGEGARYTIARRFVVDGDGRVRDDAEYVTARDLGSLWVELPNGRSGPARFFGSVPTRLVARVYGDAHPRELLRIEGELEAAPCTSDAVAPEAVTVHIADDMEVPLDGPEVSDFEGDIAPFSMDASAVVEMTRRSACVRSVTTQIVGGFEVELRVRGGVMAGFADSGDALSAITCRVIHRE
jgi:hypothetical protein